MYPQLLLAALVLLGANAQDTSQALKNVTWKTSNTKVNNLIDSMTPDEKVSLVHHTMYTGTQDFAGYINAIPRLNIPAIQMTDGEAGVNGVFNTTAIPCQINIAATFDRKVAYAVGSVAGKEGRLLNASIVLAPRVNILRDVWEGSDSQSYSEDPYLNGALGSYGVRGIQDQGTMANSKQIGPSSTGASAGDTNSEVDLQVLHEVYWAPHEALVEAGVATMMCSYAQVNGIPSCQYDELVNLTLRDTFNWSGALMSDWGATHSTAPSMIAGLDWEMGTNEYYTTALYNQVYVYKNLSESYLDRAVSHILLAYDRFGILDGEGSQGNSTALLLTAQNLPDDVVQESQQIAYHAAVRSGVLLKNEGILPLHELSSMAVIGATGLQLTNGASVPERSFGFQERKVSPFDALRNSGGLKNVQSAIGVDMHGTLVPSSALRSPGGQNGLLRNDSTSNSTTVDATIDFQGDNALEADTSYTWTGELVADTEGYYRVTLQRRFPTFGAAVNDSSYLTVYDNDELAIEGKTFDGFRILLDGGAHPWSSPIPTPDFWDETGGSIYLTEGSHNISISVTAVFDQPLEVRLYWVTPEQHDNNLQEAVQLASSVDVPIVFAHADSPSETIMQLEQGYDGLISAVANANPNTVVVLHNSDPVLMPWLNNVSAVMWMGCPGQEGGFAVADLLLGRHNPQGRLPITYPTSVNTSTTRNPAYPNRVDGVNGTAVFSEGINTSYRWYLSTNTSVLFPFGFGLSYTTFDYRDLEITQTSDSTFEVSCLVENTGLVSGSTVPQLYIGPPSDAHSNYPGIQFAVAALTGFESVELFPGAAIRTTFPISARQLSFWDQTDRSWVVANGTRSVWIRSDAQTTVLEGSITI